MRRPRDTTAERGRDPASAEDPSIGPETLEVLTARCAVWGLTDREHATAPDSD